MYKAGMLILYERRGVYEVESIGAAPLSSAVECPYYKLRSPFSGSGEVIYIPVDTDAFMRPLIGEREVFEYLELVSRLEPSAYTARKTADLAAHYRGMLSSRCLEDCLRLIQEISSKQKELSGRGKKLGQVDQQYLKLAERLVCEEFAAVLHTTPEIMKKRLYGAMRRKAPAPKQPALQKAAL